MTKMFWLQKCLIFGILLISQVLGSDYVEDYEVNYEIEYNDDYINATDDDGSYPIFPTAPPEPEPEPKISFVDSIQLSFNLSAELNDKVTDKNLKDLTKKLVDVTKQLNDQMTPNFDFLLETSKGLYKSAKTCADLAAMGMAENGQYDLDPVGTGESRLKFY